MAKAVLRTALCEMVGIDYPIVQTGMGWVASAKLTSATANAGGLGIIAARTMDLPQLATAIAAGALILAQTLGKTQHGLAALAAR